MNEQIINILIDIAKSLIIATVTGTFAIIFKNKWLPMITFAQTMKKYGFDIITTTKPASTELRKIFNNATRIRIIYVSGYGFFNNYEKLILDATKKNILIQFICAKKNSQFLKDIENSEIKHCFRNKKTNITDEIETIENKFSNIKNFEIRHFSTEYRMPFILADYDYDDTLKEYKKTKAFMYITFPPYKSKNSIILCGYKERKSENISDFNLIDMLDTHFDSIWNKDE